MGALSGPEWLQLPAARPFIEQLLRLGDAGAWAPEDMLGLMAAESDLTPTARNRYGFAGLSQLGERELHALGWALALGPFEKAPPVVQLRYTAAYFAGWRRRAGIERWTSAGHLMAANLAPGHLTREDRVVYSLAEHPAQYKANDIVDRNNDGVIDHDDCAAYVAWVCRARCPARYQMALSALAIVRHEQWEAAKQARAREAAGDPALLVSEPLSRDLPDPGDDEPPPEAA